MKLNLEQIKTVTQGVQNVTYENGEYIFSRFTNEEEEVIGGDNIYHPAGVQMKFKTDGDILRLKVFTEPKARGYFSFDVFEDGKLIGCIKNFEDSEGVGCYVLNDFKNGEHEAEIKLVTGEKEIRIVLPHSVIARIGEIELENATYITPVKSNKLIITYGDSITQGYDSLHPSNTYAMRLAEHFGAELYNKGIGGAQFPPELAKVPDGLNPDLVTVAYGTNDWNNVTKEIFRGKADAFFDALTKKHPDTPIYAFSPIWRKDYESSKPFGKFSEVEQTIKEVCEKYNSVKFISGFDLVPHDENLFGDLSLHPNDKGFKYYFENLINEMR